MNTNRMMVVALLAGAGLSIGHASLAAAQKVGATDATLANVAGAESHYKCPGSGKALIKATDVGPNATLGGKGHILAQSIKDKDWYATVCSVPLTQESDGNNRTPNRETCVGSPLVDFKGKRMQIQSNDDGTLSNDDGTFHLWVWDPKGGATVVDVAEMTAYQIDDHNAVKETPPYEFLRGVGADKNMYFVYFYQGVADVDLDKHYVIEVYYADPDHPGEHRCKDHMPDQPVTERSGLAPQPGSGQGGIGQGHEPPPDIP
jgi:hypothetical protein